ncbi:adenosylhomocysteinase [Alloscardovia criceti]|uniref:adenosylhomocysteinase n=1 Tax=Alloscardovia criceti TaxID=356828 RepID=UPI000374032F|nr:adenosylhomocysteinase [Alloscardovia criceti]
MSHVMFSSVVRAISQASNRSLAGSRIFMHADFATIPPTHFLQAAQVWGMRILTDPKDAASCTIHLHNTYATVDGEKIEYAQALKKSVSRLSARDQLERAYQAMPVVRQITDELIAARTLQGERIAISLIIEPKTAILALELQRAGAQVGIFATAAEVHQPVADELKARGILVYADAQWNAQQEQKAALQLLDEVKPTIIIDDGASFARLASVERPNLVRQLKGVAEETTSGIRAFQAMQDAGALTYPVIASNDSELKTGFDNVHGTGESCVTTLLHVLGDDYAQHCAQMAVIGYGPVGRGFAQRMRSLGAQVVIVEQSATAALKAQYEGFEVMPLAQAARTSDCLISATGVYHTIDLETLQSLEDNTVLGVIGGISQEIALDDLTQITGQKIETAVDMTQLDLGNGKHARLIASGDGMNYTISGGNPIEIMDMSFAVQLNAVRMLAQDYEHLPHEIVRMDHTIDERIARSALIARSTTIDEPRTMVSDWTQTRFHTAQ